MDSNALKVPAVLFNLAVYGFLVYAAFISNVKIKVMQCFMILGGAKVNLSTIEKVYGFLFMFGIPMAIIVTFILRAVDNAVNYSKGGKVWIGGLVGGAAFFGVMYYFLGTKNFLYHILMSSKELSTVYPGLLLFLFWLLGCVICFYAVFSDYKGGYGGGSSDDGVGGFLNIANGWFSNH